MTVRAAERRRDTRAVAAYPAAVYDLHGRLLCRGRTANISQQGAMVVGRFARGVPEMVDLQLELPALSVTAVLHGRRRTVIYRCRIIRREELGQLASVGLELLQKLG